MSESVKILIEAEDLASAKIALAARAIETNIKSVKDVGKNAKSSTEFFGTLANALGGSEIASYASQLGQVSEKVSQFSEVQKLGGAGAMAFKAGLVAVVGVLAFQVGNAIGNVIFQTEKWTKKLAEANAEAVRFAAAARKMNSIESSDAKLEIETIKDPEQKRIAYEKLLESIRKNLDGVASQFRKSQKSVEEWNDAWFKFGNRAAFAEQAKAQLEVDRGRLEALRDQRQEIERMPKLTEIEDLNAARAYVQTLRDEVEVLSAVEREREKVRARQIIPNAGDEQDQALKLVAEKERLRIAELTRNEWKRLHQEAMLLEVGGRERVDAIRLQEQGIEETEAKRMAAEQARIDLRKQDSSKPLLQARDERLLTRGTVDPVLKVAQDQLIELKSIGDLLAEKESMQPSEPEYTVVQ